MSLLAPQFTTALGYCFEKGSKELTQNYFMALKCYEEAAERGDALGYTNLAWMYENGEFVSKDMLKALEFYQLAANMGEENAVQALERINFEASSNGK